MYVKILLFLSFVFTNLIFISQGLYRSNASMNIDNDFFNGANWNLISGVDDDGDGIPGINDTAEVNIGNVCILTSDVSVKRFVLRAGTGAASGLTINPGVALSITDRFIYNIFGTTPSSDLNIDGSLVIGDRLTCVIDRVDSDIDINIGNSGLIDINGTSGSSTIRVTQSCPLSSFVNNGIFDNNRVTVLEVRNGHSFTFRNNGTVLSRNNFILRTRQALSFLSFENNGTMDLRRDLRLDARVGADPLLLVLDMKFAGASIEIDRDLEFVNSGGSVSSDANVSTIRFNRNGVQSFLGDPKVQYHNIILDGNNTKTLNLGDIPSGNMFGDLTIESGVTLEMSSNSINADGNLLLTGDCNASGDMNFGGDFIIVGNYNSTGSNISVGGDWTKSGVYNYASGDNVTFNGNVSQNLLSATEFYELTLDNTSGLLVGADTDVTGVLDIDDGAFDANGNTVTLISNALGTAQMDDINTGSYIGDIVVQRHLPLTTDGWRELYSPVSSTALVDWQDDGLIFSGFPTSDFPSFPFLNAYYYNEANANGNKDNGWVAAANVNTDFTSINNGYRIYMDNVNFDLSVSGSPFQGDVIINMNNDMDGAVEENGWNLIGNPYAASIDWDLIDAGNKSNIHDWYYIWATDGLVTPQYAAYGGGGPGTNGANGKIAHTQAFWVQGDGGGVPVLTIQEEDKDVSVDEFVKSNNEEDFLRIILANNQGLKFDETIIIADANASDGFVSGEDIPKLFTSEDYWDETILFAAFDGVENMVLSKVSDEDAEITLKTICGDNIHNDLVTMTFDNLAQFGLKKCLVLEDLHLGVFQDLMVNNEYVFSADSNAMDDRFVLHISSTFSEEIYEASCFEEPDGVVELGDLPINSFVNWYDQNFVLLGTTGAGQSHSIDNLIQGTYNVEIVGTGCGTDTAIFEVVIEAPEFMVAEFSMDTNYLNIAIDDEVVFTNTSDGAIYFEWDMGDGSTYFDFEPVHIYSIPGDYMIVLHADNENSECTQSVSQLLVVEANYASIDLLEVGSLKVFNDSKNFIVDFNDTELNTSAEISLINSLGQTVHYDNSNNINRYTISHAELPAGVYLINVNVNYRNYVVKMIK